MVIKIGSIDDDDNRIGAPLAILLPQHNIARNSLVQAIGNKAIRAG